MAFYDDDHADPVDGESGPFDAFVFQSEFQRSMLEPELTKLGYNPELGHLIRGASASLHRRRL